MPVWLVWRDIWKEFAPLTFLIVKKFLSVDVVLLVLSCRREILFLQLLAGSDLLVSFGIPHRFVFDSLPLLSGSSSMITFFFTGAIFSFILLYLSSLFSLLFQVSYSFLAVAHPTDCSIVSFVFCITFSIFSIVFTWNFSSKLCEFSSDLLEALVHVPFVCSLSSLCFLSPISLCFLHKFLSSAVLAEVIISSSFIPHCSLNVISGVVFFMLLSSIVFLSIQSFHSIHEVLKGFRDLCSSLNFVLDSGNASSPVTLDADCLSADRSHVHGHVRELLVHLVRTFSGDRVIICNKVHAESSCNSLLMDWRACVWVLVSYVSAYSELVTFSSPPPLKKDEQYENRTFKLSKKKNVCQKSFRIRHDCIGSHGNNTDFHAFQALQVSSIDFRCRGVRCFRRSYCSGYPPCPACRAQMWSHSAANTRAPERQPYTLSNLNFVLTASVTISSMTPLQCFAIRVLVVAFSEKKSFTICTNFDIGFLVYSGSVKFTPMVDTASSSVPLCIKRVSSLPSSKKLVASVGTWHRSRIGCLALLSWRESNWRRRPPSTLQKHADERPSRTVCKDLVLWIRKILHNQDTQFFRKNYDSDVEHRSSALCHGHWANLSCQRHEVTDAASGRLYFAGKAEVEKKLSAPRLPWPELQKHTYTWIPSNGD